MRPIDNKNNINNKYIKFYQTNNNVKNDKIDKDDTYVKF